MSSLITVARRIWCPEDRSGSADEGSEEREPRLRRAVLDLTLDKLILQKAARGTSEPARRRIEQVREVLDVSERRVCRVLGQHRSMQRKAPCGADGEQALGR